MTAMDKGSARRKVAATPAKAEKRLDNARNARKADKAGKGGKGRGGAKAPEVPVFIEPSTALPLVGVSLTFRSGSAHDPEGREGLARIVARMLRRGAGDLSAMAIEESINALGGELGANAGLGATAVFFEVIKRSLDPFLDLAATIISRPTFDAIELARLLREAEAELIEARDSDAWLASRAFRRTVFEGHIYGRRISGYERTLRAITRDDVVAFYERHYTRANAIVAISGDVDEAEGREIAERLLAGLPEGERVTDPAPPPERKAGRHLIFVDKPKRTQTQMLIGGLGTHPRDDDHVPLFVANTAFGGTFSSRMMQEIRAKRGWSYGAGSQLAFDRRRDAFTMWAAPAAGDAAPCLGLMLEMFHAFRHEGVTRKELDFVKSYLVRSHAFEVDTAKKRVHQRLDAELLDLPKGYHERYIEHVEAVKLKEARVAVRERLSEDDLVIAVVGTHAELGEAIAKAIPDLASVTVAAFDDGE